MAFPNQHYAFTTSRSDLTWKGLKSRVIPSSVTCAGLAVSICSRRLQLKGKMPNNSTNTLFKNDVLNIIESHRRSLTARPPWSEASRRGLRSRCRREPRTFWRRGLLSCPQPVTLNDNQCAQRFRLRRAKLNVGWDTCFTVSRMTLLGLMEKALHGAVSGEHDANRKGKLRLYAHWMTAASWKDPINSKMWSQWSFK